MVPWPAVDLDQRDNLNFRVEIYCHTTTTPYDTCNPAILHRYVFSVEADHAIALEISPVPYVILATWDVYACSFLKAILDSVLL